jgi:hypothetical protein
MCTVYQAVAISIGARSSYPRFILRFIPSFLLTFARLFFKGAPFFAPRGYALSPFFLAPGLSPLSYLRYNSRLVNNSSDRAAGE